MALLISMMYIGLTKDRCQKEFLSYTERYLIFLESERVDRSRFRDPDWLTALTFIVNIVTHLHN